MIGKKRKIILSDFDHRLLVAQLIDYRNKLLEEGRSIEDINELLLKVIDTPRHRWWRKDRFYSDRRAAHPKHTRSFAF